MYKKDSVLLIAYLQTGESYVHAAKLKNGFQTVALLAFECTGFDSGFT